jgi:general secretion pathway protein G
MALARRANGFTLIEVMLVVALVGILAMIAVPTYVSYIGDREITETITDIRDLEKEIELFKLEWRQYPSDLSALGLADLEDPWGNPYQYLNLTDGSPGTAGKARKDKFLVPINSSYDLYSMGPDGASVAPLTAAASRDDIVRANDGGFVGVASEY